MNRKTLDDALYEAGLQPRDLCRLAGVNRRSVWRWRQPGAKVPEYAWTICRLQARVRQLTDELLAQTPVTLTETPEED